MRHSFFALLAFFSLMAQSENNDIELATWHVAVGVGFGTATNPLHGGDDIPLLVLPDLAYYDEHLFFDNGVLGYTFIQESHFVLSAITELNPENRFFVFWHPANLFLNTYMSSDLRLENSVSIEALEKKRWALDAGLEYQYFANDFVMRIDWLHDITGVYNSDRASIELETEFLLGQWLINPLIGVQYRSQQLNQYYYGIDPLLELGQFYAPSHSLSPYAKIQLTWPLSPDKAVFVRASFDDYSQVSDSPLFKDDHALSLFLGLKYIF